MSTGLQGGTLIYGGLHLPLRERQTIPWCSARTCWRCVLHRGVKRNRSSTSSTLGIGGKEDPRVLIFNTQNRPGDRRQPDRPRDRHSLVNCIDTVKTPHSPRRNCRWLTRCGRRSRISPTASEARGFWLAARTIPRLHATRWIPERYALFAQKYTISKSR